MGYIHWRWQKIQHLWGITALLCTGIAVKWLKKAHTWVVAYLLTEKCPLQLVEINWLIPALSCMSMSNFLITTTLHNMEIKNIIISSNYQKHTHFPTGWHYVMNPLVKKKKKDKTYHTCLRRQSDRFVMRVIIYIKKNPLLSTSWISEKGFIFCLR